MGVGEPTTSLPKRSWEGGDPRERTPRVGWWEWARPTQAAALPTAPVLGTETPAKGPKGSWFGSTCLSRRPHTPAPAQAKTA